MYFLIINLIEISYKEEVFLALQSSNITMASYFSSKSPDTTLTEDIPLLSNFFSFPAERSEEQLIITALIENTEKVREFLDILKEADLEIEQRDILRIVVLPTVMSYNWSTGLDVSQE